MSKKIVILSIIFFLIFIIFFFKNSENISLIQEQKKIKKSENIENENNEFTENDKENIYSSNIIKDVSYSSKDTRGNEYIIFASQGEIDYKNTNIVYLTAVQGLIKLENSNKIIIKSDYGKYNINNFDTIFSKNVIINYLENKIVGEYLDFSISRNTMIITKNVKYFNPNNTLSADAIEMNIKTKDTKIYMYDGLKKVNIKGKE